MSDAIRLLLFPMFPAVMMFAAWSDLFTMTISNRLSLLLVAGFVVMALYAGLSAQEVMWHVAAGAVVLTAAFACFAFGWIGGGDAKLAAAIALWLGFSQLMNFLLIASLFGGALTLLLLSLRNYALPLFLATQEWAVRLHHKDTGVPYGIALAAAAVVVYPDTIWMKAFGM